MAAKIYSEEQLNYFRVCHIATDILPQALRLLFKQEWDNRYKANGGTRLKMAWTLKTESPLLINEKMPDC